jgi:hypothetical protein
MEPNDRGQLCKLQVMPGRSFKMAMEEKVTDHRTSSAGTSGSGFKLRGLGGLCLPCDSGLISGSGGGVVDMTG